MTMMMTHQYADGTKPPRGKTVQVDHYLQTWQITVTMAPSVIKDAVQTKFKVSHVATEGHPTFQVMTTQSMIHLHPDTIKSMVSSRLGEGFTVTVKMTKDLCIVF